MKPTSRALLLVLACVLPGRAAAQEAGGAIVKHGTVWDDLYLAGGDVEVQAEVRGDLVVAGGRVAVLERVHRDLTVAGGNVTVRGEVLDDIRAAGGQVRLEGPVTGDVMAAGGRVSLAKGAQVGGNAWLAGGTLEVEGDVAGRLRAAGRTIRLAGTVNGNADLAAVTVEVLPEAKVHGNLTYRSPNPARIHPGAQVDGTVIQRPITFVDRVARAARVAFWVGAVALLLGLLLAGVVFILLFPVATRLAARTIGTDPGKSLGLGLAFLLLAPVVAVLLMATLLGIPLGLATVALYFLWLLVGFLTAVAFLGDLALQASGRESSRTWRALFFLLALLVLGLVQAIPILGGLVLFLALVMGLGAWTLHLARRYRGKEAAA